MSNYRYFGLEVVDEEKSERRCYCRFSVEKDGEEILSFYTNRELCGMFVGDDYRQVAGNCQFSLPESKDGIRRKLKKMADEVMEDQREKDEYEQWKRENPEEVERNHQELMDYLWNDIINSNDD